MAKTIELSYFNFFFPIINDTLNQSDFFNKYKYKKISIVIFFLLTTIYFYSECKCSNGYSDDLCKSDKVQILDKSFENYKLSIRNLLDIFDELRENLRFENIEFPKILFIGDQSAGKTSVLEAITKISLPRGESTTTRCPTIIQLRSLKDDESEEAFIRIEGRAAESANKIQINQIDETIRNIQNELIKDKNTSVSETPIYLNVRAKDVPDLTLYDMPGLTYSNPEEAKLIKEMYIKYLQASHTILLLVISGTTDFTSSEVISIVKEHCKNCLHRTYVILTKADAAASIDNRFQTKVIKNWIGLDHTPFVLRLRNQEELEAKMPLDQALQKEIKILAGKEFEKIPSENKGTFCLLKKLLALQKEILINHKNEILKNLEKDMLDVKIKILNMPESYINEEEKYNLMKNYFLAIDNKYQLILSGKENLIMKDSNNNNYFKNLGKSENINKAIKVFFQNYEGEFSNLMSNFFSQEFYIRVKNDLEENSALYLSNLMQGADFHKYVKEEVEKTQQLTYQLVDNIGNFVLKYLTQITENIFGENHKRFQDEINLFLKKNMESKKEETIFLISELYKIEIDRPYTFDKFYLDTIAQTKQKINEITSESSHDSCITDYSINSIHVSCENLKNLFLKIENNSNINDIYYKEILISCFSYVNMFKKRFVDYVLRILLNKLVYYYKENLHKILEERFSPLKKENMDLIECDKSREAERLGLSIRYDKIKSSIDKLQSHK